MWAILFVNETVESTGLFNNFFWLFLPDPSDTDLEMKIAKTLTLMKVDVSNDKLKGLMQGNGVTQVPCLVVYSSDGKVSYRGAPHESNIQMIEDMFLDSEKLKNSSLS